ncbi:MAG: D-alanine--D-alanine ligase [Alphaproteobacteria bacterium]|nr:D-alanine--D-alanine ligase [Alphaproteobacteria bacterium]
MSAKSLAILYSGSADSQRPDDADTLAEAAFLRGLAEELGYQVAMVSYAQELSEVMWQLDSAQPQVVLNLVQSVEGSDADIDEATATLDVMLMPYTGSDTGALRAIATKPAMKSLLRAASIPTPEWLDEYDVHSAPQGTYIVKSVSEHCSLGIDATSIVSADRLPDTIADRKARFGGEWFAEGYLPGREFNVSLLADSTGVKILPIAELSFAAMPHGHPPIVDYAGKWEPQSASYSGSQRVFPPLQGPDGALLNQLASLALACWRACGLSGYARVDFRLDAQGNPWVIDVNANPCLSSDAGFMAAAAQARLPASTVLQRILDDAASRTA